MASISKRFNRDGDHIGWQARVRRLGWPTAIKTFESRKAAEAWAATIEARMASGTFIDRRQSERVTLNEVIDTYVREIAPTHRGEITEVARLRRFQRIEVKLCEHALARLTPEHFEAFRDRRLREGVTPSTVRRELNLLHGVIESRRRQLRLLENPLSEVKRPTANDERSVRLSHEQWHRLIQECRREKLRGPWVLDTTGQKRARDNIWLAAAVELLAETGARRSELMRWTWQDTFLDDGTAIFRDVKNSHDPSAKIDRSIGLSPRAISILRGLPRSIDNRIIPLSVEALKQGFERARERAGLTHFRMHDLRHEFASRLHEAGWSPVEVMAQGGWRDPKSMKRYSNLTAHHLAARFRALKR